MMFWWFCHAAAIDWEGEKMEMWQQCKLFDHAFGIPDDDDSTQIDSFFRLHHRSSIFDFHFTFFLSIFAGFFLALGSWVNHSKWSLWSSSTARVSIVKVFLSCFVHSKWRKKDWRLRNIDELMMMEGVVGSKNRNWFFIIFPHECIERLVEWFLCLHMTIDDHWISSLWHESWIPFKQFRNQTIFQLSAVFPFSWHVSWCRVKLTIIKA